MKAWKATSLCLLLALSLISYAVASPTPAPLPSGSAACASVVPAAPAPAPASAAAPLAALWATDAQSVGGPFAPLAKACSLNSCSGTGGCVCPNGRIGTCVNGNCTF